MHLLVSFVGGLGHYEPLRPVARAASARGHRVTVACHAGMAGVAAADGWPVVTVGDAVPEPPHLSALMVPDRAHELAVLRDGFARGTARRRAVDLGAQIEALRPDAVLCDEIDYGAALAAERAGLPAAIVLVTAAGTFSVPEVVDEPLRDVRRRLGLDPAVATPALPPGTLVVAPFPPSFRHPGRPLPPGALVIRPAALEPVEGTPLARGERPLVLASLGTIFNLESGDLFARVLAGLGTLDVDVLATVGRTFDPGWLGPLPPNVRVEGFVPQALALPAVSAVVSHGGSGSVIGALAHGVPLAVAPMGADQPDNAARVTALGAGLEFDPVAATPAAVACAVRRLLDDPSFGDAAATLAAEARALPGAGPVVDAIEGRVGGRPRRAGPAGDRPAPPANPAAPAAGR